MSEKEVESVEKIESVPLETESKDEVKEVGENFIKDDQPGNGAKDAGEKQSEAANDEDNLEEHEAEKDAETKLEKETEKETEKKTEKEIPEVSTETSEKRPPLPARKSTASPLKQNPILNQLKEAFPGIEEKYVKAVIIASQGALDPAFNALLYLSDPSFENEAPLPSQPTTTPAVRRQLTQMEQDEILARQLDEQFNKPRHQRGDENERHARQRRIRQREQEFNDRARRSGEGVDEDEDFLSQFVDKDLPQIRDTVNRNIQETSKKVGQWFSGITKTFSQEEQQGYATPEKPPTRARFNSFGARVGEDSMDSPAKLESHGISLRNNDEFDNEDEDVPPQLPSRSKNKVVAETAYIDTPDMGTRKKWQPLSPEPLDKSPSKAAAKSSNKKNPDEDEFLINSDDEM